MSRLFRIFVSIWLLAFAVPAAASEFSEALNAYRAGDYAAARAKFFPLAQKGDTRAMHNLAHMYRKGQGVAVDLKKSFKYFEYAAHKGFNQSQFQIARMYQRGEGVKPDAKKAFKWMRKAADSKNARAHAMLGVWYATGIGTAANPVKAMMWHIVAKSYAKGKLRATVEKRFDEYKGRYSHREVAAAYNQSKKYLVLRRISE